MNCICDSVLKWAFWLLSLPSMLIEIAVDIFIVVLPLRSHEKSRTHKEKKMKKYLYHIIISRLYLRAFVLN